MHFRNQNRIKKQFFFLYKEINHLKYFKNQIKEIRKD